MSYSTEIKHTFIELRSQGLSLDRIAEQLGINKSTALDWQRRFNGQIAELKAFRLEAVCERVATKYEDELAYAWGMLKHIRTLLRERGLQVMSTASLHYAEELAYRRVQRLCALAQLPDPPPGQPSERDAPADAAPASELSQREGENPTKTQPFPHQKQGGSPPPPTDSTTETSTC
jgi:transposase